MASVEFDAAPALRSLVADKISNKVSWMEITGWISHSDLRISNAAQKYFKKEKYYNNKNQGKRLLIRRLIDIIFDANLSIFDIAQQVKDEIRENSDAKALEYCISIISELAEVGWHHTVDYQPIKSLTWRNLDIRIEPYAILKNGNSICLLYTYFRQSPPLSTDGVRALLSLVRLSLEDDNQIDRIVILDCYKDKSYEASDFETGERWISNQLAKVLERFSLAYRIHLDRTPPTLPTGTGKVVFENELIGLGGTRPMSPKNDDQLSFQLI